MIFRCFPGTKWYMVTGVTRCVF